MEEVEAGRKDMSPEKGQGHLQGQAKGAGENYGVLGSPGAEAGVGKEGARGTADPGRALGQGREGIRDEAACWACSCWRTEGCTWNSGALRGHRGREGARRAQ